SYGSMFVLSRTLFCSCIRLPVRSRLFPYTTLFRSDYAFPAVTAAALSPDALVINSFSKYFCMTGWRVGWMVAPDALVRQKYFEKDRKSTRLNSSHQIISYAVLCLKQKILIVH